jgi:hypothetical protein
MVEATRSSSVHHDWLNTAIAVRLPGLEAFEHAVRAQEAVVSAGGFFVDRWLEHRREAVTAAARAFESSLGCASPIELATIGGKWWSDCAACLTRDITASAESVAMMAGAVSLLPVAPTFVHPDRARRTEPVIADSESKAGQARTRAHRRTAVALDGTPLPTRSIA